MCVGMMFVVSCCVLKWLFGWKVLGNGMVGCVLVSFVIRVLVIRWVMLKEILKLLIVVYMCFDFGSWLIIGLWWL